MGTDITCFVEQRSENGRWSVVDELVRNEHYSLEDTECINEPLMVPRSIDIPRCSGLFAVLAGIRSGARHHVPFSPICTPRGLPTDATEVAQAWHHAWKENAFSTSWLSLEEIDRFDWGKVVMNSVWQNGVEVTSPATYADIAGYEWFHELLKPYRKNRDPRLIFWFDQ